MTGVQTCALPIWNESKSGEEKKEDVKIYIPEESKEPKGNNLEKKEETLSIVYKLNDLEKSQDQSELSPDIKLTEKMDFELPVHKKSQAESLRLKYEVL